jgi:hypothetical protein
LAHEKSEIRIIFTDVKAVSWWGVLNSYIHKEVIIISHAISSLVYNA